MMHYIVFCIDHSYINNMDYIIKFKHAALLNNIMTSSPSLNNNVDYIITCQMEENMKRAQVRDAVKSQMFYFRKNLVPEDDEEEEETDPAPSAKAPKSHDNEYTLMNVDTIINGKVCTI